MKYNLNELYNIEELTKLCESFTILNGVVTALLDLDGNILIATGWQPICTQFHRCNNESNKRCLESDTILAGKLKQGNKYNIYKCKNGLIDVAMPIIVGGVHVGNFFTGQFLSKKPDIEYFRKQAQTFGYDEKKYLNALKNTPVFSEEKIEKTIQFLVQLTEIIGNTGLQKLKEIENTKQIEADKENLIKVNKELLETKKDVEENEARLRTLINTIPDLIWLKNQEGNYLQTNSRFEDFFGAKENQIIGKTDYDFVNKKLADSFRENDKKAMQAGKSTINEELITFANDGHEEFLETIKTPIYDKKKTLIGVLGIGRNITSQKIAEQELLRSNSLLYSIIDSPKDIIIFSLDKDYNYINFNKAHVNTMKSVYNADIKVGQNVLSYMPLKKDRTKALENYEKALKGERFIKIEEYGFEDSKLWYELIFNPIKNEAKEVIGFSCFVINITSRKKADEKIKLKNIELLKAKEKAEESEKRFSKAILDAPFPIMIHSEGEVLMLSSSWTKITGYTIKDIPTITKWSEKAYGKKAIPSQEFINKLYELKKEKHDGEWEITTSNNNKRIWEFMSTPLGKFPDGRKIVSSMAVDITERIEGELILLESKQKAEESDRLKTEFLNNMSHEIRTPMNGIMGFSSMLNDNGISKEKRANFIKIIQSSGQQLLNVIDDILDISRLGTKQVKVINSDVCLNDVLLELFSTFDLKAKEQKNPLYLKKALSDKQSTIRTDITKLNKVLSNLLENALKFTNEGFIEFGYQLKNNNIELYIKDTGIGIEKSKHESIFERFSQAEKGLSKNVGGLGLGLSIAKENAELLGGKIELESKEGKGTTFFVTIPYKPIYKVNDTEKEKKVSKYTILIAEDEEINYLYLETMLKEVFSLDCIIIHVTNGKDAIEACKENKTIDLVLMDLKMPVMNGFEASKLIKKLRPNLPVIAQTAYSTSQDKEKAILVGCDFFISKPIRQQSFKNILDKYLIK